MIPEESPRAAEHALPAHEHPPPRAARHAALGFGRGPHRHLLLPLPGADRAQDGLHRDHRRPGQHHPGDTSLREELHALRPPGGLRREPLLRGHRAGHPGPPGGQRRRVRPVPGARLAQKHPDRLRGPVRMALRDPEQRRKPAPGRAGAPARRGQAAGGPFPKPGDPRASAHPDHRAVFEAPAAVLRGGVPGPGRRLSLRAGAQDHPGPAPHRAGHARDRQGPLHAVGPLRLGR